MGKLWMVAKGRRGHNFFSRGEGGEVTELASWGFLLLQYLLVVAGLYHLN